MARRLKTIVKYINLNSDDYKAYLEEGYCNTDSKISGTRLRRVGKGRYGNKIIIKNIKTDKIVFEHNSAETYRNNQEVEDWLTRNTYIFRDRMSICNHGYINNKIFKCPVCNYLD